MPIPQVTFSKDGSAVGRGAALEKIENWSNTSEVSTMKRKVLKGVLDYAKTNLVNIPYVTLNREQYSSRHYEVCDAIFRHADLPDILFMQHILNEVSKYKILNNELRDVLLPIVLSNKNILMIPRIHKTRKACACLALFGLVTRFRPCILFGGVGIVFSEQLEEWRVSKSLENKLALKETHGVVARVEDGYDDISEVMIKVSKTGYGFISNLFYKLPLAALLSDDKKSSTDVVSRSGPK